MMLRALSMAHAHYMDWCIRKEFHQGKTWLHLYIEFFEGVRVNLEEFRDRLHGILKQLNEDYRHAEEMLGYVPLKITQLRPGSFARFTQQRLREGADIAHLKPARIQPSDEAIALLLEKSAR